MWRISASVGIVAGVAVCATAGEVMNSIASAQSRLTGTPDRVSAPHCTIDSSIRQWRVLVPPVGEQ
jgi:hypothetical protein